MNYLSIKFKDNKLGETHLIRNEDYRVEVTSFLERLKLETNPVIDFEYDWHSDLLPIHDYNTGNHFCIRILLNSDIETREFRNSEVFTDVRTYTDRLTLFEYHFEILVSMQYAVKLLNQRQTLFDTITLLTNLGLTEEHIFEILIANGETTQL